MKNDQIVIVGGGHAAAAMCSALSEAGQGQRVHLVCKENELPYHRPPLSKNFLKNLDDSIALHKSPAWYNEQAIQIHLGDPAVLIDRKAKKVILRSGENLDYQHIVLATGTRARTLDTLPPSLRNVHMLRNAEHARSLRILLSEMVSAGKHLTILGGGFIGLEVAASARQLGLEVTVLEVAPRLLGRSVSTQLGEYVLAHHHDMGTTMEIGARIENYEVVDNRLRSIQVNGQRMLIDELILGIGAIPETRLASECGLTVDNGIVVDEFMRTSDPAVLAIGDCAAFPTTEGARVRLESVQNANDQARTAASALIGRDEPYASVPWFWSEQGSMRMQMAGLLPPAYETVKRPGANANSFTLFHVFGERLLCAESINAPLDHMMSRKLIEARLKLNGTNLANTSIPLKSLMT